MTERVQVESQVRTAWNVPTASAGAPGARDLFLLRFLPIETDSTSSSTMLVLGPFSGAALIFCGRSHPVIRVRRKASSAANTCSRALYPHSESVQEAHHGRSSCVRELRLRPR